MKKLIILSLCCILLSCTTKQKQENVPQFSTAETLINYIDKTISLEGKIVHVCSAGGKKMKLILSDGEVINVLPTKQDETFSKSDWHNKTIQVTGKLSARTITKKEFDAVFAQQHILCHIDLTPCIDTAWVNNQWKNGYAEDLIATQQQKLYTQMAEKATDYLQQFSIIAENLKEIATESEI